MPTEIAAVPTAPVEARPAMTVTELEHVIDTNVDVARDAWVRVALALREIRDRRLYTYLSATFEAYVESRFGRTRQWAYQLITSVTTIAALSTVSDPPTVARHVRALAGVAVEQASAAWDSANAAAQAENRAVTADDVTQAVRRVRGQPADRPAAVSVTVYVRRVRSAFAAADENTRRTVLVALLSGLDDAFLISVLAPVVRGLNAEAATRLSDDINSAVRREITRTSRTTSTRGAQRREATE